MENDDKGTQGYPRVLKGTKVTPITDKGTQGNSKGTPRVLSGYSETSNVIVEAPLNAVYNLVSEIKEYVDNSIGSFSVADIDRDLGLGKDQARNRRKILSSLYKDNKIIRVRTGVYERSNVELEKLSLRNVNTNPFDIELPLGLSDLVHIPKKSIMIIAGTSNAGKTQFALESMKLNLQKNYALAYFMSEMGHGEYVNRVNQTCAGDNKLLGLWEDNVFAAPASSGFAPAVATYCKNGFGVIDYLEAVDGEYHKLTNDIKMIYDRIDDGVVLIAMQKGSGLTHARGGEGTKEKARLYINLDTIYEGDYSSLVSMSIAKAKEPKSRNVTGLEIHLEVNSHSMTPVSDWMRLKGRDVSKQRLELFERYQSESDGDRRVRMLEAVPALSNVPY